MPTEKPQAPEGCDVLHAPWLDPVTDNWKCLVQVPGFRVLLYTYCRHDLKWKPDGADTTLVTELLRLAAQRDRLVKGLELGLKAAHSCTCAASFRNDYDAEDYWDDRIKELKALIAECRGEG